MSEGKRTESKRTPFDKKFDDVVTSSLAKWHIPGLAVAIVDGDDTFTKCYGHSDGPGKVPPTKPVTPETLFYMASTTKAFTAAAFSLLVSDEKDHPNVNWTTPLSDIIRDDFVLQDPYWTTHITAEDCLSHRTGLPRHDKSYGGKTKTVKDLTRSLRHLPFSPAGPPRTNMEYCNLGFMAVSHAIETLTHQNLGQFVKDRIWDRLDMHDTFWRLEDVQSAEKMELMSSGYEYVESEHQYWPVHKVDFAVVSGAGCIISNVLDYSKWVRAMMRQSGPVSKEQNDKVTSPIMPVPPDFGDKFPGVSYGLGWFMTWYHGEKVLWHPGGQHGYSSIVLYVPGRDWAVTMLANSMMFGWGQQSIVWHLVDELLNVPVEKRLAWDEKNEKALKELDDKFTNARKELYPTATATDQPIPHSLDLSAYTGTYTHPAYQSLIFTINQQGRLFADVTDYNKRTWPYTIDLEHVSGEHFLARARLPHPLTGVLQTAGRAEFRVDASGKAASFGAQMESDPKSDLIWFERDE